jgi:hypothetical protein
MILKLIDGREVEIFRQTCGHYKRLQYNGESTSFNINPIQIVQDKDIGYFAIMESWGDSGYHDNLRGIYIHTPEKFKELIPISSIVSISKIGEWEKEDE